MGSNPQEYTFFLVFGLFAVLVIALIVGAWLYERKRRQEFQALADRLGLSYRRKDPYIAQRFQFLDRLCRGSDRYAFNILEGERQDRPVCIFDFHYATHSTDSKGRRKTEHHYFSCFVLEHELAAPELLIFPENFLHRVGKAFGLPDIDFESNEFSRAFVVQCKDKRFAYDICHTRMMEYLLAHRDLSIEIERNCLSISFDQRLKVKEIPQRLEQLLEMRDLFPNYLFRA